MTRLEENAKAVVWLTIGLGAVCGLIDAVAHPQGWEWVAARAIVSLVFAVAVTAWLVPAGRRRWALTR